MRILEKVGLVHRLWPSVLAMVFILSSRSWGGDLTRQTDELGVALAFHEETESATEVPPSATSLDASSGSTRQLPLDERDASLDVGDSTSSHRGWISSFFRNPASQHHSANLYAAPEFLGGFYNNVGWVVAEIQPNTLWSDASTPIAGGASRLNIADNNKALTEDRVFFDYNHFQNVMLGQNNHIPLNLVETRDFSVDRYTLGFEKTFRDHLWSIEMCLPITGAMAYNAPGFEMSGNNLGNLQFVLKRMIYETETTAVAAGLGVDAPTGGDAVGLYSATTFRIRNEAVHLDPFIAFLLAPRDRLFCQCFFHVDTPVNGKRVDIIDPTYGPMALGVMREQSLFHFDFATGYWLRRNKTDRILPGLAAVLELHYTYAWQESEGIASYDNVTSLAYFSDGPMDTILFDMTVGLHAELAHRAIARVGLAFPLRNDWGERSFDSEILAQVERRF